MKPASFVSAHFQPHIGIQGKDSASGYGPALLAVAERETSLIISGTGDVIEPEDGLIAKHRAKYLV